MEQLIGKTLGRYQIERLLGRGGMASVYQATDPSFGRVVAIKVLAPKLADDQQFVERFLREARSLARLQHPHILPVYDVGEHNGTVYLVMQYVDAGNLHERLVATRQGKRLSLRELLSIMRPLADALDYAHRRGVIHRDIKPQNILLTAQQHPYLSDFGIAKIVDTATSSGSITNANTVIGTPDYMSPEQGQGLPLDGRADLYSLGVILYEVFTGRPPFRQETDTETPLAIMMRHITTPPPSPRTLNPQLPLALETVLLRALAKHPDDRYPTGTALLDALEEAVGSTRPPQAQGETATTSLSDYRLPGASTPVSGPLPAIGSGPPPSFGGWQTPTGTPTSLGGSQPPAAQTPLPFPLPGGGMSPPAGPISPPSNSYPVPAAPPARQRRTLIVALGAVAVLLVLLAGVAAVIIFGNGDANTGANLAANTPLSGTVIAATGATATVPPVATAPATSQPAASAAASVPASAPPSPVASAPASATPTSAAAPTASPSAVPGGAATPAKTTKREVILFSSHRNNLHDSQIYTMNPDGSGQRVLIDTRGHSWGPRVSPDGKQVIFSTVIGDHGNHTATGGGQQGVGHHEVFRANTDGSDIVRLTNTNPPIWNNAWAWSPDGKSVAFASDRDGNWELYRMAADGTGVTRLTTDPGQDGWPTWTPDGKSIIFASDRVGKLSQIFIMDADGKNPRRLIFSEAFDTLPAISRDGKFIVYSSQSSATEGEIYIAGVDGSNPTRLTSTVAMNTDPSFSPDGTKIVFTSDRDRNTNIYMMDRDGKNVKRLTDDPGEDVTPYWAVIEVAATSEVTAVAVPGSELVALVPRWRED